MGCGTSTNSGTTSNGVTNVKSGSGKTTGCVEMKPSVTRVQWDNKVNRDEGKYNPKKINAQKIPDDQVTEYQENTSKKPFEWKEMLGTHMRKIDKKSNWERVDPNEDAPLDELMMEESDSEDDDDPDAKARLYSTWTQFITLDENEPGVKKATDMKFPEEKISVDAISKPKPKSTNMTNMLGSYIGFIGTNKDAYAKKEVELNLEKQEKAKKTFFA